MQKIEKWRLEELALVLKHLAELLEKGDDREWAKVFLHFHQESKGIIVLKEYDLQQIRMLLTNIKNCYSRQSSFMNLDLQHENEKEKIRLNQEFYKTRARLLKITVELEDKSVDYVS